jgi:hypothetical protein
MNKEYELSPYWHAHIIASEARPDELLDPNPPTPRPGAVHACAPWHAVPMSPARPSTEEVTP